MSKEQYNAIAGQINNKQQELDTLTNQIRQLQIQNASLQQISGLQQQQAALNSQLSNLQGQLSALSGQLSSAQSAYNTASNTLAWVNSIHNSLENKKAKNQEQLNKILSILNNYSKLEGKKLNSLTMTVENLPPEELAKSDAAKDSIIKASKEDFDNILAKLQNINFQDAEGKTILMHALTHGFTYGVQRLLILGADVNIQDNNGATALIYACSMPNMNYTPEIIRRSENVNLKAPASGDTALHCLLKNIGADKIWSDEIDTIKQTLPANERTNDLFMTGTFRVNQDFTITSNNFGGMRSDGFTLNQQKALVICRELKNKGADFSSKNNEGLTSYLFAYRNQQKFLVEKLKAESIIDIESLDQTGFQGAAGFLLLNDRVALKNFVTGHPACIKDFDGNGDTLLHFAVQRADPDSVTLLTDCGADLTMQNLNGLTPLFLACATKNAAIAKYLFNKNANIGLFCKSGNGTLSWIAELRDTELLKQTLNKGADINHQDAGGKTLLLWMIQYGWKDVVDFLLGTGADVNCKDINGNSPIHYCVDLNNTDNLKALITKGANINCQNNQGQTPFYFACLKGNIAMINTLKNLGADINILNKSGFHPIHGATHWGHREVIEELMKFGVLIDTKSVSGYTPLQYYCELPGNNKEVVKFLLGKGADLGCSQGSNLKPLLHSAVISNNTQIIELLLEKGCMINAATTDGVSPLYGSLGFYGQQINLDTIRFLINKGADVNRAMNDGDTPMHMAGYRARADIIKLLKANSGNINAVNHAGETPLYVCIKQDGYATNGQKLAAVKYFIAAGATIPTQTPVSIFDSATQHLPDVSFILEHPETLPALGQLESELFGTDNL